MTDQISFALAYRVWEIQLASHVAERNHTFAAGALRESREDAERRGDWRPAVRRRLEELRCVPHLPRMRVRR